VGLNLTRASYVFHLDPWWNPAVESQASDRAHRIGQNKRVTVKRLLMHHSIEEKMMQLKKKKSALSVLCIQR
jgi:non-specific serine/threonine protein kinase